MTFEMTSAAVFFTSTDWNDQSIREHEMMRTLFLVGGSFNDSRYGILNGVASVATPYDWAAVRFFIEKQARNEEGKNMVKLIEYR